MKKYHLHLVSDATGETIQNIARACLVQFDGVEVERHLWSMVRSATQVKNVVSGIENNPGAVIFTLIDNDMRRILTDECGRLNVPCISVLDGVMQSLSNYFGTSIRGLPGRQHLLDAEYFDRIDAMDYAMSHDDGQGVADLSDAKIVLVGVSRTSKTPTSIYIANHSGIKTANVPFVPGVPLREELLQADGPFIIGLTASPDRLVQIRRNRLLMLREKAETDYVDPARVKLEVAEARKLFGRMKWPVIDVTRRSIEETAAAILQHYGAFHERKAASNPSAPER